MARDAARDGGQGPERDRERDGAEGGARDRAAVAGRRRRRYALARTVTLVGLMGAGKSSVGRALAQAIGVPFRDADREIERAAAMSVPEIFERFGEPYFREGERRVIARLLNEPPHVLATGGGAYMDAKTRRTLRERARTIWLRADLDTLTERCRRRGGRPLLAGGDAREALARLMEARYPIYAEADHVIDSRDAPLENVVNEALGLLEASGLIQKLPDGEAAS